MAWGLINRCVHVSSVGNEGEALSHSMITFNPHFHSLFSPACDGQVCIYVCTISQLCTLNTIIIEGNISRTSLKIVLKQ